MAEEGVHRTLAFLGRSSLGNACAQMGYGIIELRRRAGKEWGAGYPSLGRAVKRAQTHVNFPGPKIV
jgi:hypothetical protein